MILRQGDPAMIVPALAEEMGAEVHWNRLYGADACERDNDLKQHLHAKVSVASLLVEPGEIKSGAGHPYRVYTPFWKVEQKLIGNETVHRAPANIPAPEHWPGSDDLGD